MCKILSLASLQAHLCHLQYELSRALVNVIRNSIQPAGLELPTGVVVRQCGFQPVSDSGKAAESNDKVHAPGGHVLAAAQGASSNETPSASPLLDGMLESVAATGLRVSRLDLYAGTIGLQLLSDASSSTVEQHVKGSLGYGELYGLGMVFAIHVRCHSSADGQQALPRTEGSQVPLMSGFLLRPTMPTTISKASIASAA